MGDQRKTEQGLGGVPPRTDQAGGTPPVEDPREASRESKTPTEAYQFYDEQGRPQQPSEDRQSYRTVPGGGSNRISGGRPNAAAYVGVRTVPPHETPTDTAHAIKVDRALHVEARSYKTEPSLAKRGSSLPPPHARDSSVRVAGLRSLIAAHRTKLLPLTVVGAMGLLVLAVLAIASLVVSSKQEEPQPSTGGLDITPAPTAEQPESPSEAQQEPSESSDDEQAEAPDPPAEGRAPKQEREPASARDPAPRAAPREAAPPAAPRDAAESADAPPSPTVNEPDASPRPKPAPRKPSPSTSPAQEDDSEPWLQ